MNDIISQLCGDADGHLTLNQAERIAKDMVSDGQPPGEIRFDIVGPMGRISCYWIDPFLGFFQHIRAEGFLRVVDFEMYHGLHVENMTLAALDAEKGADDGR